MSPPINVRTTTFTLTPVSAEQCTDAASGGPADTTPTALADAVCRAGGDDADAGDRHEPFDTSSHETTTSTSPAVAQSPLTQAKARVDAAVTDYRRTQDQLAQAKDGGRGIPLLRGNIPALERALGSADSQLKTALDAELDARGPYPGEGKLAKVAAKIAARYDGTTPELHAAISRILSQSSSHRIAESIVAAAQRQTDPPKSLRVLSDGYKTASPDVRQALLHEPAVQHILDDTAKWANGPLKQDGDDVMRHQFAGDAMERLERATRDLDPQLAADLVERAAPGYGEFAQGMHFAQSVFNARGIDALMSVCGRLAGTQPGDAAVDKLVAGLPFDPTSARLVRDAVRDGANPAYATATALHQHAEGRTPGAAVHSIASGLAMRTSKPAGEADAQASALHVAAQLEAKGIDAKGATKPVIDALLHKTQADVKRLAEHSTELAWLVHNDGAGLSKEQLARAVADYRSNKGAAWQAEDDRLRKQVVGDGVELIRLAGPLDPAKRAAGETAYERSVLADVADDPSAALAFSAAVDADPGLLEKPAVKRFANVFAAVKLGDTARKFLNEAASAYLRQQVLQRLPQEGLTTPAAIAEAKKAIGNLRDEQFARLLGVSNSDLNKAVDALEQAADEIGSSPERSAKALATLNARMENDAALSKTFNKATFAGQLLRGVGIAFAGASLINSSLKASAPSAGIQDQIKLIADAAGLAQKSCDLLVGLGKIDKQSLLGKFGGEWKLAGRAGASEFIAGLSVVLDGVSAVRSGFGLGTERDLGNAALSAAGAVGGGLAIAPALGASASLGPIGLGVTAASIAGKMIYEAAKDAHKYEDASRRFLHAGGYSESAARALSGRVNGAAKIPFLSRYAGLKQLSQAQAQQWINGLTSEQIDGVSGGLGAVAIDTDGDPQKFDRGAVRTRSIPIERGHMEVMRMDTLGGLEREFASRGVPLP